MIGSDPEGRLGEAPRPELREQGRISGACFDAARGIIPGLKVYWYAFSLYKFQNLWNYIFQQISTELIVFGTMLGTFREASILPTLWWWI